MVRGMIKEPTTLSIRRDIKRRAIEAVNKGLFPGISSLSGLVEYALQSILDKAMGSQQPLGPFLTSGSEAEKEVAEN